MSAIPESAGKSWKKFRWIFSQVLAASAVNLTLIGLGMAISFSTILIPALLGSVGELSFSKEEASWFGSVNFILQPIGSILSGPICDKLGRKVSLVIANLPHVASWLMIYFAKSNTTLFIANGILGIGTGFMEAPILTYVGEISHPSIRGSLITYCEVFATLGMFIVYLLGSVVSWRVAALYCLIIPVITVVSIIFIPESPVWLLTKDRKEDSQKALCWIRGWSDPKDVESEFKELQVYQEISAQCSRCNKQSLTQTSVGECPHKNAGWTERLKIHMEDMTRKEMMRPFCVSLLMFFIVQTIGLFSIRPNLVNVYNSFGMGVDGHVATAVTGALGIIGTVGMMLTVKSLGKRFLNLFSLFASTFTTFLLGSYAYIVLPHDISSYEPEKIQPTESSWLPLVLFIIYHVAINGGIVIIPWIMLSEIFPLRGRGLACGLAAAFCYIMSSISAKLYYNIETMFGIYGAFWMFSFFSLLGLILMYYLMPETEGKSFEEIEREFSGKYIPVFANDCISRRFFKKRINIEDTSPQNDVMNISTIEKEINKVEHRNIESSRL